MNLRNLGIWNSEVIKGKTIILSTSNSCMRAELIVDSKENPQITFVCDIVICCGGNNEFSDLI